MQRYLVRFDDICPTMDWTIWEQIEPILLTHGVKPILAVVPDNQDSNLVIDVPLDNFWERVRQWQEWGWTIALHGYQHLYHNDNSGLMRINRRSEFAGLPANTQREMLTKAIAIFEEHGIRANVWVAPAHSFDETTVQILCELGIQVISDGFYLNPVKRLGAIWIPQQLWKFRKMFFGLWTVCYHSNKFSKSTLVRFEKELSTYSNNIISLDLLLASSNIKNINVLDRITSYIWLKALKIKQYTIK